MPRAKKVAVEETIDTVTQPEPIQNDTTEKVYLVPETKEEYLALHKLLKDLGVNSIGDLEVRASRL